MVPDTVHGVGIDAETRCTHYDGEHDVVALKLGCCSAYFACHRCHEELAGHPASPWPAARRDEPAARCGVCETTMRPEVYMAVDTCPDCDTAFNPGCANHYHRYFEWIDAR